MLSSLPCRRVVRYRHSHFRGSLDITCPIATTEELTALYAVVQLRIDENKKRDECAKKFELCYERNARTYIGWTTVKALSDEYDFKGGRWIFMPIRNEKDKDADCHNRSTIANQLIESFFCGKFAECGYVDEIIYRNLQLPRPNCTFSIVNAYTIFNTKVFTGPVCVKNDAQVDHVRKFLLEMGILRPDLIYYLKYKAKICSVCHITGNVNVKLPDSGQLLRFDPHIYYADLKIVLDQLKTD